MSESTAANEIIPFMADLERMIAEAPEDPEQIKGAAAARRTIEYATRVPERYRPDWERPDDSEWLGRFSKIMGRIQKGGIVALIGNRGTGKTRFAAEAVRNYSPDKSTYTTAMGLFLRIRASFGKKGSETEQEIVNEMSLSRLLVLDEIQERGNSAWEDRILTHILDRRYGSMVPTILVANLSADDLKQCLGDSISSRINETGGIMEITGKSYREV